MNPLILISGLGTGGAERVTVSFLRHLRERRSTMVPICSVTARHDGSFAGELAAAGIERLDLGARRLTDPLALIRLVALVRRRRVDLVHAHGQDAAVLARWARRAAGFRLVITRHVIDEPDHDWRQRTRARETLAALRAADAVVAVSRGAARRLSEAGAIPPDRIDVIPNGIRTERFDPVANAAFGRALRRELVPNPDAKLVLMPAVLRPGKGHELLLDAVPAVRDRVPTATFALAGAGRSADALRARAAKLDGAVRFLGHRNDMPHLMAAADLVCLPSRSEALPTVLMEAAAAGRPVVASRVGGVREVVEHGRTGVLVAGSDPCDLAAALIELLKDPERRRKMGRTALRKAAREFGAEPHARRTVELWRRVLGEDDR